MKNGNLIIKIAVGISGLAAVVSIVTLIRDIVIHASMVFPIIQTVGSIAIFAVCFLLLRSLSAADDEEEESEEDEGKEEESEKEEENG